MKAHSTIATAAYRIILLAIRHIPDLLENPDTRLLIESLEKNWEPLPFIEKSENRLDHIAIHLAFWLAKPPILVEIAQNLSEDKALHGNALFSLLELEAADELKQFSSPLSISSLAKPFPAQLEKHQLRSIYYLMKQALKNSELDLPFQKLKKWPLAKSEQIYFDALEIWKLLLQRNLTAASQIFKNYPQEALHQETSPLISLTEPGSI